MDSTLEKIYSINPDEIEKYNDIVMLGSGQHGICFVEGKGMRLKDINGKSYLDCTAQGWALFLGHANEEINEAVCEQMGMLSHLNQNSDSLPRYALAKELTKIAPEHLNRVLFTISGSAAIEAAMKIAAKNILGANKFITLKDGYHGTSLTTGAGSWISTKTAGMFTGFNSFSGITNDIFVRVPNPFLYHWTDTDAPEDCIDYCLKELNETIASGVNGAVAAVIVEPLQASGGQIPIPPRYLHGVREICDKFGCLLIFDELQTYCRIGDYFAACKYEVEPDIICIGKSLGAGFPIAAIIIHDRLDGFGPLGEDIHTFSNNCVSQVAALKQLDIIEREGILNNVNTIGGYMGARLENMKERYPFIGDIRQVGLHIGVEFVFDGMSKEQNLQFSQKVKQIALSLGLILGDAGYRKNILKIKPPLIITKDEADEALDIFENAMKIAQKN